MTFEEWSNNQKKKKQKEEKEHTSFAEWSDANSGLSEKERRARDLSDEIKKKAYLEKQKAASAEARAAKDDIAPVHGGRSGKFGDSATEKGGNKNSATEKGGTVETTQEIFDKWGKYYNESDYDEYSKKGASIVNPTYKEASGWLTIGDYILGGKKVANKVTFSRDNRNEIISASANGGRAHKDATLLYEHMTDFEVGIYNYLLAKNGEDAADEFLADIEETLTARQGGQIAEKIQNTDNGVLKALNYGAASISSGMVSFGVGVKQLFSEEAEPVNAMEVANQILSEDLTGFKKDLYQAGNTVGNMLPSVGVGLLNPLAGQLIQSSSAAGNAYRQSLMKGKTKEEAAAFGVMTGGLEFVTSKLLGGAAGLTGDIPKKMLTKISTIENALFRVGAKYGISLASEITEEELQLWLEPLARTIAFGEDYDAPSPEEMAETAIVTAISTGILNSTTDIATGNLTKVEGLSKYEAKVIEAEVKKRIAEQETDGKKLTNKQKNDIREAVIKDMDNGQLDIDTIESTLGGKTYEDYKSLTEKEESLTSRKKEIEKEIASLVKTPKVEFTVEQDERLASLREEAKGIKSEIKSLDTKGAKNRLSDEVYTIAKNTRLAETYNDKARRRQAFTVDLSQYKDDKQKAAVERAIKSGVLNNTFRSHQLVDTLSRIEADKGITFDYTNNAKLKESGFAIEGAVVNGYADKAKGAVTLNVQSSKAWQSTVGHEITHVLEGTEAYGALREALYAYAESKGELASRRAALPGTYKNVKDVDLEAELTADLVGDYLFSDKKFIDKLTGNRTLFQKVWDEVKYLCKVATGKELTEIEKVEREFARAWKEYGKTLHIDNLFETDESVNFFETDDSGEGDLAYSISVTDKNTLDSLNEQVAKGEYDAETNPDGGYYVTYKSMSFWGYDEDGNAILRSPMAEYVDGELSNAYLIPKDKSKLNWYQATETIDEGTGLPSGLLVKTKKEGAKSFSYLPASENQDLIAEDWSNLYFNLRKKIQKNGKWVNSDVPARYNPYEHSSNSMLNDQFTAAYQRDNLVTVKMIVPISEDNGAYRAQWSKDATGWSDWKSGIVAGKIAKQKDLQRKVYLSRYAAPVEIVPDSEVAQAYKGYLEGTDVAIPDNVVSPNLLNELKKAGVPIEESGKVQMSLSSIANTFYGDPDMTSVAFEESDYKQTEGYKNYVNECLNNMRQTRADFDEASARKEIEDQVDGIVRVAKAAAAAGYDIYDDPNRQSKTDSKKRLLFSSLEPNSDYFTSNDISTICDKRKNFAEIYDDIVRAEEAKGVPKGKRFFDNVDNYFYLHNIMAKKGLTQPCRMCYVESMRKNLAPMANAFLKLVNETDVNNRANDQLYQPSGKNKGQLKSSNAALRERVLEVLEEHPEYGMTVGDLTVEMLTTEDGLAQLKIQAPLIYEAFNSFYGQSKPKMPKSATPFRFGELTALLTDHNGNIKWSLVDKINSTGGFRLQSYSDFQIQNFTDVLQVIYEAGTLGLNGHAYTKVPAFLEATEGTNLKRNISIFMYKDGNEWKIDRNDSFPYALEEIYDIVKADKSGNTSIIAVSQNKEMSAWIMANDYIGQGIPFHKSGLKMGTVRDTNVRTEDGRIVKGYSGTIDHTKQQTEVWAKANEDHKALTKVKKGIDIYSFWDFDNVENLSKNELIAKNLKRYIDECEAAGYLPKFRDYVMNNGAVLNDVLSFAKELGFTSQDATIDDISFEYKGYRIPYGYYKFLGDFGMFKPDGTASPHDTLSLKNYDFDKAEKFFADAESLRRNEILQQFANGEERRKYRDSDLSAEELAKIVDQKRKAVVDEVVGEQPDDIAPMPDVQHSLSREGEEFAPTGNYSTPLRDLALEQDIAPTKPSASPEEVEKIIKAIDSHTSRYEEISELIDRGAVTSYIVDRVKSIYSGFSHDAIVEAVNLAKDKRFKESLDSTSMTMAKRAEAIRAHSLKEQTLERMYELGKSGGKFDYSTASNVLSKEEAYEAYNKGEIARMVSHGTSEVIGSIENPEEIAEILSNVEAPMPESTTVLPADIAPAAGTNVGHTDAPLNVAPEAPSEEKPTETAKPVINKPSFVSDKASALYNEVKGMKKGVKVSGELGYLLDNLDLSEENKAESYNSLRTALTNIKNSPDKTVNESSAIEAIAREMIDNAYDDMAYSGDQLVAIKLGKVQANIEKNKADRKDAYESYQQAITVKQAELDSKKDKNTKLANSIRMQIARLERLRDSTDAQYAKSISALEERAQKMQDPKYGRAMRKRAKMEADAKWAADLVGDTSTWRDKKLGLQYATNTERRNLRDIVRDATGKADIAKADSIDDALNGQYNREQAEKNREQTKVQDKYAKLKITKSEDAYIQMLGELRHNPDTTLTEQAVKEYYEKHKSKIDTAKVDKVIEMARRDYDELISRLNDELRKQGMREIPYRKGYFPHFTEPKQNFIQKLLNWKTQDNEIPTSIAGLTETFKPTRSWQSFDKTRHSDETDYSFLKGFDSYLDGALDWIYHMDTLQKRRAVENHIRYTHSDEGIRDRIKQVYANEDMDANEAQAQIEAILAEANNPLNNFVQDFTTHTNILAGKKNSLDRTVEQWTNRKIYSVMQNVQNRTSANMVLANVRSALTNFIPITQSWAQVSPIRSLQAAKETIANSIKDDGTVEKSTFLTNRLREADKLYKTNWDKVLDKAGIMFEIVDNFSSQVIWRSKYNQNLANGMSEAEAIRNADQFAENVMAGRSKGNEPTLFNAKNPFVKAFTMFQLEVNNQYGYLFKDVPTDLKAETEHWKFNLAKGYTTAFIGAYVYNALLEKVTGNDAALDPIGIIEDLLKDLGLFGEDDEEEELTKTVTNLVDNVVEELPFVGGIAGGGRIPISSAIPYGGEYGGGLSGFIEDVGNIGDGGLKNIGKEMMNPLLNVGLPVAGGQLKKTVQGLGMFSDEHPVSGSYTDSGKLRFPVEKTPLNIAQAAVFGQYASKNAREYFDNDYAPLGDKQIQEYIDVDMPISDYWKYREGLAKQDKLEDKFDYINDLDLPIDKKNILANNVTDRKEKVDLTNYDDFASLEEFDYANKNPEKYEFLNENGITYSDFANADEDTKNFYSNAYESVKKNPAKRSVAKAVSDSYVGFYQHTRDINSIKGVDANGDGKTDSGSVKANVHSYIFNEMDLDYGAKCILFKNKYNADDTYNYDIIDYLNNRQDLTYEERVTILTELGFRVENGYIYMD